MVTSFLRWGPPNLGKFPRLQCWGVSFSRRRATQKRRSKLPFVAVILCVRSNFPNFAAKSWFSTGRFSREQQMLAILVGSAARRLSIATNTNHVQIGFTADTLDFNGFRGQKHLCLSVCICGPNSLRSNLQPQIDTDFHRYMDIEFQASSVSLVASC